MNNNKEILKATMGCLLLWASYWLLQCSSELWLGKDGFLWGALVIFLVGVQHSIYGFSAKLAFGDIEKAAEYVKMELGQARWFVDVYCVLLCYFGWKFVCLGWLHWWTGVMASLIFGPYMLVGVMLILLGFVVGIMSVVAGIKRS